VANTKKNKLVKQDLNQIHIIPIVEGKSWKRLSRSQVEC
jgi:hypothetical protein